LKTFNYYKHFPVDPEHPTLYMGLQPIPANEWIQIDTAYKEQLHYKEVLFEKDPALVSALGGDPTAERELLFFLSENLPRSYPTFFSKKGNLFSNQITGRDYSLEEVSFSEFWIGNVQEDVCLLKESNSEHRLISGIVAFPSQWSLSDKLGKTSDEIHEPVPFFQEKIARQTNIFLNKIKEGIFYERFNWTLHPSTELHCPRPLIKKRVSLNQIDSIILNCYLRVERQVLFALPVTNALVFTIKTYLNPIRELSLSEFSTLQEAIHNLSPRSLTYKGILTDADV